MPVYRHRRGHPDPDDGFAVTNAYDVPLWDFVKARDLDALGYPISQRWTDGPFTLQAFQKVILQWHPGKRQMNYFNTLDALANRYPEIELPFVPAHQVLAADRGMDFGTVTRNHLGLLEQNAAIKARFLAEPDWLNFYLDPVCWQGVQLLRNGRCSQSACRRRGRDWTLLQNTPLAERSGLGQGAAGTRSGGTATIYAADGVTPLERPLNNAP